MGSYTFTWEHPAGEVFVTGTFDDWAKSVKLEKEDGIFKKTVELPKTKVEYKFVVDGNWVTNDSAPGEFDGPNYNNVLQPEDIKEAPVHMLSSVTPTSTTAAMAGAVPKEEQSHNDESVPGAFPETPATEPQSLSVNPIPATEGFGNPIHLAPGEKVPDPSTLTNNTIQSTVKDEPEEEKSFGVAPIPATAGAGNPIHLAPGEKVPDPSTITSNTISSTAKTDAESYEKSDSIPPQLGPVVTPEAERTANGGMFGLPPVSKNIIPESSLPMGTGAEAENDPGVTIQSAAPLSSTAALAALVPKEPRGVPEVVTESQEEAHVAPEASGSPEAVEEKREVEEELLEKVPEAPPAAESASGPGKVTEITAGGAPGLNGAPAPTDSAAPVTEATVPEIVTESQKEAHFSPEAAANPEAVGEKAAVESELLKKAKTTDEASEPAPTVIAETSEAAPSLSPDALADAKPLESSSTAEAKTTSAAPETPTKGHERSASDAVKGTPDSIASGASKDTNGKKKKNRLSFFKKLQEKFHK